MPLHLVLSDKLRVALEAATPPSRTRRDARLPAVPGRVHAVIGLRRAGKTTFLHQLRDDCDGVPGAAIRGVAVQPAYEWLLAACDGI